MPTVSALYWSRVNQDGCTLKSFKLKQKSTSFVFLYIFRPVLHEQTNDLSERWHDIWTFVGWVDYLMPWQNLCKQKRRSWSLYNCQWDDWIAQLLSQCSMLITETTVSWGRLCVCSQTLYSMCLRPWTGSHWYVPSSTWSWTSFVTEWHSGSLKEEDGWACLRCLVCACFCSCLFTAMRYSFFVVTPQMLWTSH